MITLIEVETEVNSDIPDRQRKINYEMFDIEIKKLNHIGDFMEVLCPKNKISTTSKTFHLGVSNRINRRIECLANKNRLNNESMSKFRRTISLSDTACLITITLVRELI